MVCENEVLSFPLGVASTGVNTTISPPPPPPPPPPDVDGVVVVDEPPPPPPGTTGVSPGAATHCALSRLSTQPVSVRVVKELVIVLPAYFTSH